MAPNGTSVGSVVVPDDAKKILAEIASRQGITTPRYDVEAGSAGARDGYSSSVYRISMTDEDHPEKARLPIIFKKSQPNINGDVLMLMFTCEADMYNKVLPVLEEVGRLKEPLPWPRCYYASVEGPPPYFVGLRDLKPEGYAMADRSKTVDVAHCRTAVYQLARLHAAGLALKHHRPDEFDALRRLFTNTWGTPGMRANCMAFFIASLKAPDLILDKFPVGSDVNTRLMKLYASAVEDNIAMMCPIEEPGFTIIHGDCHVNNMMFQYDKAGKVTACRLIDFQTAQYGSPAVDLCTLLLVCAETAVLDNHWDELMREYHTELQSCLLAAGCPDPDAIYSWELLQNQLSKASAYGMVMMPLYYNALFTSDEAIEEFRKSMEDAARMAAGSGSEEGQAPAPGIQFRVTPAYKSAFEGLVLNMIKWGWLPTVAEIDERVAAHAAYKKRNLQR